MKRNIILISFAITLCAFGMLCACGDSVGGNSGPGGSAAVNDDYFSWGDTEIYGISDEGMNATHLVIPERAESVDLNINGSDTIKSISFESDDVQINLFRVNNCTALESVELPSGITRLDSFSGNTALTAIVIPDSVVEMNQMCFRGCTSLKSVTLSSGLTELSYSVFDGCTSLESIVIPEGVTEIYSDAFYNCSSLSSVELPETLEVIGRQAFYGCNSLDEVTIPESVTNISTTSFLRTDGEIMTLYVKEGSWADINRDEYNVYNNIETY